MLDRCYLAAGMPSLIIWGDRDAVIPVDHARIAHAAMPGSRLEIFAGAGHFPHHSDPARFRRVLEDFLATTRPASHSPRQWRTMLREHGREAHTPRPVDDPGTPTPTPPAAVTPAFTGSRATAKSSATAKYSAIENATTAESPRPGASRAEASRAEASRVGKRQSGETRRGGSRDPGAPAG
jgi:hypothetical protein